MLIYLMTHENVLLIESKNMTQLLEKVYHFTAKFNQIEDPRYADKAWPEGSVVFTKTRGPTQRANTHIASGGPPNKRRTREKSV